MGPVPNEVQPNYRAFWLVQFYWVFWLGLSFVVSFVLGYILTGWP